MEYLSRFKRSISNSPYVWIGLSSILIASFIVKFTILNKHIVPPSADYGNYLTMVNILHGNDVTGFGLRYPPLFFLFLDLLLKLTNEFMALKIAASIVSTIIAIPFFFIVRKFTNDFAALLSALLFVFAEAYSEMISWGGLPNFLAIFFMLCSLYFLINAFENPSKKNLFLTGIFLSLVVGSHHLTALFFIFVLILFTFLILIFNRNSFFHIFKILLTCTIIGLIFSLPYIPIYWNIVTNLAVDSGLSHGFLDGFYSLPGALYFILRDGLFIWLIVIGLGLFALGRFLKKNRNVALLLISLFLIPFILSSTIMWGNPTRSFYFILIPILISFGLYLEDAKFTIKNLIKRDHARTLFIYHSILVFFITIFLLFSSFSRLSAAAEFYYFIEDDELEALKWIKENTDSNDIIATSGTLEGDVGSRYGWWIQGFSERKSFMTGPLHLFVYKDEREQVDIANKIFSGTYIFDNGCIRAIDAYPSAPHNPEIAINMDNKFQNSIFFNDGEIKLYYSPISNPEVILDISPYKCENKTAMIDYNQSVVKASFNFEWVDGTITRSIILNREKSYIDIVFEVNLTNSIIRKFDTYIWGSYGASFEDYNISTTTVNLYQRESLNNHFRTKILLVNTSSSVTNIEVFLKEPRYLLPCIIHSFDKVNVPYLYVKFRISSPTSNARPGDQINYYNSYSLIEQCGIDYIFLNKGRISEYYRFLYDEHFKIAFENERIVIFKYETNLSPLL